MTDRDTVVNRMEIICNICKENVWRTEFSSDDIYPLLRDAIALLNEQKEEIENLKQVCQSMMEGVCLLKEQEAVKPGEWIYCKSESVQDGYKCSECGFFEPRYYAFEDHNFITDYAYCPSCGKPMQKGRWSKMKIHEKRGRRG